MGGNILTKTEALHHFFSGFGVDAYPSDAVPDKAKYPFITYEMTTAAWGDGPVSITVNLWYYTESEAEPNAQVQRMSAQIGRGGVMLPCDGAAVWLTRGAPWCTPVVSDDNRLKRRYINITAEYLTAD